MCSHIANRYLQLMTTEDGKFKLREFSDDHMCRLYEKFVLEYYKKHHPELKPCAAQIEWNIDTFVCCMLHLQKSKLHTKRRIFTFILYIL